PISAMPTSTRKRSWRSTTRPRWRRRSIRSSSERGEVELPESDRGAHDSMAKGGDAPAARAEDLRHQSVDVEAEHQSGRVLGLEVAVEDLTLPCAIAHRRARAPYPSPTTPLSKASNSAISSS